MKDGYRHEYKFLISPSAAVLLRHRLPGFLRPDPHAGSDGHYTIRSLYFDDFSASAYQDKLSGIRDRTKYRLRLYNYDDSLIRLERKEKQNDLTRKVGQTVTRADAAVLQQCLPVPCPDTPSGLAKALQLACSAGGLRPAVLVDYDRTPFVCPDGNTRITLDENLRTLPFCTDLFASHHAMIPVLESGMAILEVKFDDFLPGHLREALADIPKDHLAISKFALCMNLL